MIIILCDLHFTGIDLGEVQDLVDDGKQVFRRLADGVDVAFFLLFEIPLIQKFRHTVDCVHGGTDFVGHVGQEVCLRFQGVSGFFVFLFHLCLVVVYTVNEEEEGNHCKQIDQYIDQINFLRAG